MVSPAMQLVVPSDVVVSAVNWSTDEFLHEFTLYWNYWEVVEMKEGIQRKLATVGYLETLLSTVIPVLLCFLAEELYSLPLHYDSGSFKPQKQAHK